MAGVFEYTYQSWDKLRPSLLKSTGLGDALKKYEAKKNALKSARALSDLIKLQSETVTALEAVEVARKAASKSCGSLFKECKAALDGADSDRELKRATGFALSKLNQEIVEAAAELKDNRSKLDARLAGAEDNVKKLAKISKAGLKPGDADYIKKMARIYAGEGDAAVLQPEGMIREMMLNRTKLANGFPSVAADLNKMNAVFEANKQTDLAYRKQTNLIRKSLQEMDAL